MATATSRTLKLYRDMGYDAQVVERFNPFSKTRIDLFGCIDIVAVGNNHILGLQSTTMTNKRSHLTKIYAEPRIEHWLKCKGLLHLVCWRKLKVKRGGKAVRWEPDIENITLETWRNGASQLENSES